MSVLKINRNQFIHVKDKNTNAVRLVIGPKTFTTEEYEEVVKAPTKMILVPPEHFVVITNPVVKDENENIVFEKEPQQSQVKLRVGEKEIVFHQTQPFPLYPGQDQEGPVTALPYVAENEALLLQSKIKFTDRYTGVKRNAGVQWLFKGPGLYRPQNEILLVHKIPSIFIGPNQAPIVTAANEFKLNGETKKIGQSWLVKKPGPYLPSVHEEVGSLVKGIILDKLNALHVFALRTFTDEKGRVRKAGTEWLVTMEDCDGTYFPGVYEKVERHLQLTILKNNEYCVILNPFDKETGKSQIGAHKIVKGPTHFFLQPEEKLRDGPVPKVAQLLTQSDGIWLTAKEEFVSDDKVLRKPGSQWFIKGPGLFYPPLEADTRRISPIVSFEFPFEFTIFHAHHFLIGLILFFVIIYFSYPFILPRLLKF